MKTSLILALLLFGFATPTRAEEDRPAHGFVLGLGYGNWQTLPSEYLDARQAGYATGTDSGELPRDGWHSLEATFGGYFSHGSDQILVDFVFSSSRWGGSAGYRPTNLGDSVPVHRESSYVAAMARYRRRLFSRVFVNAGYGIMSDDNVVRADNANIGGSLGQGDDPYPAWAWGVDLELMRPPRAWLLAGVQFFHVLPKEPHETPDWQLVTFSLTMLMQ